MGLWVFMPPEGLALHLTFSSRVGRLWAAVGVAPNILVLSLPKMFVYGRGMACNKKLPAGITPSTVATMWPFGTRSYNSARCSNFIVLLDFICGLLQSNSIISQLPSIMKQYFLKVSSVWPNLYWQQHSFLKWYSWWLHGEKSGWGEMELPVVPSPLNENTFTVKVIIFKRKLSENNISPAFLCPCL